MYDFVIHCAYTLKKQKTIMNRKKLYAIWKKIRAVKMGYLVIAFLCMLSITVVALRHNNQQMIVLRDAVYQADKDNGDVEGALRELRQYVYGHMNTNLNSGKTAVYPPLQLKYTYERLVTSQQDQLRQQNAQVYSAAQEHCERLHPATESHSGGPRVPCIRDYVSERGVQISQIPDSIYKFDFVSPRWSPDLAGWSLLATIGLALITIARMVIPYALKRLKVL